MTKPISLLVGLGNPGAEYENTRHNAGVWFVQAVTQAFGAQLSLDKKFHGLTGRIKIDSQEIHLLVPTTYMNLSGQAVSALAKFYKIPPDAILVAHDELDIDAGTIRLKTGGGHGGHNGLRDIIKSLGNQKNFHRVRIGIGHPGDSRKVTGYVLGKTPISDREAIESAIDAAVNHLSDIIKGDSQRVMNQLHRFKA